MSEFYNFSRKCEHIESTPVGKDYCWKYLCECNSEDCEEFHKEKMRNNGK